jgi:hypothetical protein
MDRQPQHSAGSSKEAPKRLRCVREEETPDELRADDERLRSTIRDQNDIRERKNDLGKSLQCKLEL